MANHAVVPKDYVLGIDLGTNSAGWAMIAWKDGGPFGIVRAGSRVFDAGMDVNNKSGKESSRNLARRSARAIRRQHWRRGRRLKKLFHILKRHGLLPDKKVTGPDERQNFINELDRSILASPWFSAKIATLIVPDAQQVMPYVLRAAALDEPLDPFHFGRALFHLAQRRGFESNRKERAAARDKEEEEGKVKSGITELQNAIVISGARTLGEYFSRLDTREKRIRQRWTARAMYKAEFEKMWDAQARFHPALLTTERKNAIHRAIFFQRKLRAQKYLIGKCVLEPGQQRAPAFLLMSQRFRVLQKVNDLRVLPSGEPERQLFPEERDKLLRALELEGDQTFTAIRKLLGLSKTAHFNLAEGGETRILGNRTASKLRAILGERWLAMSAPERDQMVEYLNSFERGEKLAQAACKKWNLDEEAEKLAAVALEADYLAYSRVAMEKLLPTLEEGGNLQDAIFNAYGERKEQQEVHDLLPPVDRWREIRNPGVTRSLTELRKIVNAIVREYGKPVEIRIELARDLRQTKAQREKSWKKNRENERSREKAKKKILEEVGLAQPSGDDIRKVLLAEECNFLCPYTGRESISMRALVGHESQYDIEHIIPFSRSLDNSFANLTLCYHEENRNVKRNQTPTEAYATNPERFQEILARVKRFRSDFAREKVRRFQMTTAETAEAMEKFTTRQLNDTRYATRLAGDYLALLYGGRVDASRTQRIRATAGQITSFLRNEWKLNTILQDGPTTNGGSTPKSRDDHRHHAVDAVVTALTDDGTIHALSRAAERAPLEHRKRFATMEGLWPNFVSSIRAQIETIVVSHKPQKKVSGAMHEETFYSAPVKPGKNIHRVRKRLAQMSKSEVEDIVDDKVRKSVQEKLAELGKENPADVFADEKNLPSLTTEDGRQIPIKSARVFKKLPTFPLGSGRGMRHVASDSNHHIEIFTELAADGSEVEWDGCVVSLVETQKRSKLRQPVVQREFGPNRKFVFSLSPGEIIECNSDSGERKLYVLRKMSQLGTGQIQIGFAPVNDARQAKIMQTSRVWLWSGPNSLRSKKARKVVVNPLGEVAEAHD